MVELLSPAGSFDSFLGALNAGADAVYLGGERYSARAYADNFTQEQIIKALDIAHFYGRKVYLTANTLLKDTEAEQAATSIEALYEHHLDGVIVQDPGLAFLLAGMYPDLPLHASTQMTVTGPSGAALLKEKGFSRVVPARELDLEELKEIRQKTDMELECFIHGAMCYSYSGQCLFSSILGGRSGNRGRCAQPCRLPYTVHLQDETGKAGEQYPLSMKDLCTIYMLPELIDAGIDSFKIEGRMKDPAYTCGVTALYRKYIDLYQTYGRESYHVSKEDAAQLLKLYVRSDIHDGYYQKHNSQKMIGMEKPGYIGSDDALMHRLSDQYVKMPSKHPVCMQMQLHADRPATLTVYDRDTVRVEVQGEAPEKASNRPITEAEIRKQLQKTGNSLLHCERVEIQMQDGLYLSVKALNELRRNAVSAFEEEQRSRNGFAMRDTERRAFYSEKEKNPNKMPRTPAASGQPHRRKMHASVMSLEQLEALTDTAAERLYVDADLWMEHKEDVVRCIRRCCENKQDIYLMLPQIVRKRDHAYYQALFDFLSEEDSVKGLLLRNLEQVHMVHRWKKEMPPERRLTCVGDSSLYQMNRFAADFTDGFLEEYTLPYELNYAEQKNLCERLSEKNRMVSQVSYGRIPMMISANCIKKTTGKCDHIQVLSEDQCLEDRYKKKFPVYNNCIHCYNVIYNSVPYSLHNKIDQISHLKVCAYRLDFVTETGSEARRIFDSFYGALLQGKPVVYVPKEFTTGHFSRGVE